MKRFMIYLCIISMIAIPAAVFAEWELPYFDESFVIRNGISFGMSKEEVTEIEKQNGNYPYESTDSKVVYEHISFLGRDAVLSHHFTKENEMKSFAYVELENSYTFSELKTMLCDKYGDPMLTDQLSMYSTAVWSHDPFGWFGFNNKTGRFEKWNVDTLSGCAAPATFNGSDQIINYAVWLIKYNDHAVVVELVKTKKGMGLGYACISHEEMENWAEYEYQKEEKTKNSYKNDI